MVAKPSTPVRSANAGEFDPGAKGRVDIKQYYSAGLAFKNVEPVPQGGFRQMGGTWRVGKWRKPLAARAITSPTNNFGPNGGTQTIFTGTVAGTVAAVLLSGLAIDTGTASIFVDVFAGGVWVQVAGPFAVKAGTAITRLAAFAPGAQKTATALRVSAIFSTSATVSGLTVAAFYENGAALKPRYVEVTTDEGDAVSCFVTAGIADFWTEDGYAGAARLSTVTELMLPDLGFYAEGRTIGIFHGTLETARLFLATPGQLQDWRVDLWPYAPVPLADLGDDYPKTDDVWDIFFRWANSNPEVFMTLTVDDESTPALPIKHAGAPVAMETADASDWTAWCADIKAALEALPSLGPTVTVTATDVAGDNTYKMTITFGGALSGEEYQLSATITNTADASALPVHTQVGETEFEPLFSSTRGWPGGAELLQDRLGYYRIAAQPGAQVLSKVGEYFDLNAKGPTDSAARLDRLRSQTSETVLHIKESGYFFLFTDRGSYFATNRTIERNTPLNYVKASEIGAQPNCRPFDLEGGLHYTAIAERGIKDYSAGGNQLLRLDESAVTSSTSFEATPVSLLASHLWHGIIRQARQKALTDLDASKGWGMRADGRLVAGQFIRNQEITGFCEWRAAAAGLVREIGVDGRNDFWLAVDRAGDGTIELYDSSIFLQDALTVTGDLAGVVTGLPYEDGAELWAVADGYVLGPFACAGGRIDLRDPYNDITVGRWQPPRYETMPQVFVTPGDDVIFRPGRIHTMQVNIIDTTSLAVGANGEPPRNIVLNETSDPVGTPMPAKTRLVTVDGSDLPGFMSGTTAVITQLRPGQLRVRDIAIGAKL